MYCAHGMLGSGVTIDDLVQGGRPAHEGDATRSVGQQVLHGHSPTFNVVNGQGAVPGGRSVLVDEHHRGATGAQGINPGSSWRLWGEQYPSHPLFLE